MRNLLIVFVATMLGQMVHAQERPVIGCFNPYGVPGSEACVDDQWKVCKCIGWKCYWTCPEGECPRCPSKSVENLGAGGCSDPSDLDMDLRAELDSSASSCEFSCNCIASGNQIAHKLYVDTPEACDYFCKSFPKYCKFWTLIKSKGICFALTNCNYPKCGPPFNNYISGPRGCPPSRSPAPAVPNTSFTVTNRVQNRIATKGVASFQGVAPKGCAGSFKNLAFGKITTITVPTSCLPLIELTATLNGGTICKPFVGLENLPQNVFICAIPNASECYVSMNQDCKK